jgi:hypothetical protein
MTTHKGSQKGYLVAQDIIERIQQQCGPGQPSQEKKPDLKGKGKAEEPLSVEVNYVLVRPAGEREHKWVLPVGWEQQRNVYHLELPLDHEIDEVDQKNRKRKASTSASTRSRRPPKETKASTSATTRPKRPPKKTKASTSATTSSTRQSTRIKNVGKVEE